jgi:HK97 family phage major capsid protein
MSKELQVVLDEINKTTTEMRSYVDKRIDEIKATGSADPLTASAIEKANNEITELRKQYDELAKQAQRPQADVTGAAAGSNPDMELRKSAFVKYLRHGVGETGRALLSPEEQRALNSLTDTDGGFMVPTAWESEVLMAAYNEAELRPLLQVGTTGRDRVMMPSLKKPVVAWGNAALAVTPQELSTGSETLSIFDLKALVLIHNNTLDDTDANIWGELNGAFASAIAEAEDNAFTAGDGATMPQGVLTNKDVRANFTKTGVAAGLTDVNNNGVDALITMLHSLKKTYRRRATWAMNSATEGIIRQLKDEQGQYLWQPPVQAGSPALLLGRPVVNPEGMDDVGADKLPIVLGDFRTGYKVRDRAGITVQRLVERYAEYDQTGFIVKRRTGGKVTMAEAFRCLKVST